MADVLGKKISELAETTDLAGLFTIGSDKNNQSKKVSLQFVKEAADYANAQGDYAKTVGDTVQGNTGVNEYPVFSASKQYAAGDVVLYDGRLYKFTALHPAGAWVGTDAIETSIKAETDVKLTELESEVGNVAYNVIPNRTYDNDKGVQIAYTGRCATDKIPFNEFAATNATDQEYEVEIEFWQNDTYLGYSSKSIELVENWKASDNSLKPTHIAFTWKGLLASNHIYYTPFALQKQIDDAINQIDDIRVGNQKIKIVENSAWDTDKGKVVSLSNYSRSERMTYNEDARLSFDGTSGYTMLCWNGDGYQGSIENATISPYTNTTMVAFYWKGIVDNVIYSSILNKEDKIEIESNIIRSSAILLGKETSSSTGKYVNNANTCCTPRLRVKENDIITTSLQMYTIARYNENGEFIAENSSVRFSNEYVVEAETAYIVIVFRIKDKASIIRKNNVDVSTGDYLESLSLSDSLSYITGITLNGKKVDATYGIVNIPAATNSKSGLLSPTDKQKLDTLQSGTISVNGSGVMKNASAFGFLPSNDGITNAENLQQCLNGGGTIVIDMPGVYLVSRTLLVDSNTSILIGNNVIFKKAKGSDGVFGRHTFLNRGALYKSYNENITIKGLNLVTDALGVGTDIQQIFGLRGEVAMFYVKNLHIDGFTCLDGDAFNYNIHVCTFEDIVIENVHIEGLKDGIHLGRGRKFVIRHCKFATNDDAIAINAHDYPASNAEIGDLEDGIIEDITYLKAPSSYAKARGALMIVGSWSDWKSGNRYIPNGDTVVSNGRIYMTYGSRSTTEIVSTIQPTHEVGVETYADGVTWVMKQDNVVYSANVRRVNFNNIYCYRNSSMLFPFYLENDAYVRCYYPNSIPPIIEDITISNVHIPNDVVVDSFAKFFCPFRNLIVRDSDWSEDGLWFASGQAGNTDALVPVENYECNLLTMGIKVKNTNFARFVGASAWNVRAKILGTMSPSDIQPVINGSGMTLLQSDL